jgi:rsbT co-antagonist protein RsbR
MGERGAEVYSHLLKSMTNFVAMLDTDGRFEFTNRPSFGYTEEELIGKRIWESQWFNQSEESQKEAKMVCEKALHGEKAKAYTTAFNKEGVALPIVLEIAPLKDDKGTIIGAVAEGKSIIGWRRLEAKLKETVEKLKASQEELSTPITQIWEHILVLPIIGVLDSHRAQNMMETLLTKIMETQSEVVIVDVTGVASIDTEVASHIMKTVQATSLLGASCVLTGIRPEVAQTVIHLGLDLEKFVTKRDLQDGLKFGLEQIGYEIRRKDSYIAD